MITLGQYPDVTLAQAREAKEEIRQLLALNIDPQQHKKWQKLERLSSERETLKSLSESWLKIKAHETKLATQRTRLKLFNANIYPHLADIKIKIWSCPR